MVSGRHRTTSAHHSSKKRALRIDLQAVQPSRREKAVGENHRRRVITVPVSFLSRYVGTRELSNVIWLAIGEGTGKVGFFVANLYLARVLHPADYGLLVVAQSLIYYAWQATDLGTTMHGIRQVARNTPAAGETAGTLLTLRIAAGTLGAVICLIAVTVWPLPPTTRTIFDGACCYLLTRGLYPDFVFKGLERFRHLAFGSIGAGSVFLVLAAVLVRGPAQAALASFLWSFSWLVGAAILIAYLYASARIRLQFGFRPAAWLRYLRESIHFAYTGILVLIYDTLPILLLGVLVGASKLGLFSAVYRLLLSLTGVSYLFAMAVYPTLASWHASNPARFKQVHRRFRNIMLAGGLIAAIIGMIFAKPIVAILLGRQYVAAVPAFRILALDLLCYAIRFTYGIALGASGLQKYYTIVSLTGLTVLAATFIPATRIFGLQGAAASVVLADACVGGWLAYILNRKLLAHTGADEAGPQIEVISR